MARDGAGNYSLPSGNPVVTNTIISSSGWANPTLNDIAAALTQSLSRDGQTTPTADLTMGNFKLRNLANAIARTDAVPAGQIQDGGLVTLASVAGTDTITASSAPAITAYTAGQTFDFIAAGTNTTGVVTLNINSIGAKAVTKYGAQGIQAGDIVSGQSVRVRYDGTQFQMISPASAVPVAASSVRNLAMTVAAAGTSATLTADEIVIKSALGGPSFILPSFSKTINLATTGAGGMDTGTAPVSGFVAIYAIYNPTTGTSALLAQNANALRSEVYSGANMPSGYTASALVSVWQTNASSQFVVGGQRDRVISKLAGSVLSSTSTPGTFTSLSISAVVPANTKSIGGTLSINNSASATVQLFVAADVPGTDRRSVQGSNPTAGFSNSAPFDVQVLTAQTIYWSSATTGGTLTSSIEVTRYTI